MERAVTIHPMQQVTADDLTKMGTFPRASMDHIVKDGIDAGQKYTGFPVSSSGPLELTIGSGRFYKNGEIYYSDFEGGTKLSFADLMPAVTKKIVTVALWGNTQDTAVEPRAFLKNVETNEMESQAIATESRRVANLNLVPGQENANPQAPALQTDVIAVAFVTLTPSGIDKIEMVTDNQLASVQRNGARLKALEIWKGEAGTRLDTLGTELSNLGARLKGTVRYQEVAEVQADMARVKTKLEMSDALSSYGADRFLSLEQSHSDNQHPDFLSKVEEGVRFPPAQQRVAQITLNNPLETGLTRTGDFALPAYDPILRLALEANDGEIAINSYPVQTLESVQKTRSKRRIRYGSTMTVCTNSAWWRSGYYDSITGVFRVAGQTWDVNPDDRWATGINHQMIRVTQFFEDTVEEAYWEAQVKTISVSGAILAQSFLNSQDGWLTHIDLFFTQIAAAGDVDVLLTETTNGAPDMKKVLARTTMKSDDLKTFPKETKVPVGPCYVTKGQRYAVVLVSAGAHVVSYIQGNKYAQGTLFYFADGGDFAVADPLKDLAMNIYFAQFKNTRTEIQIKPLELENGIALVDILTESFVPQGCELIWQVQVDGKWRALNSSDTNVLIGLHPLLNTRVVFVGTTDLAPSLTFGPNSIVTTSRCRTDFCHISAERTLPTPVNSVEVLLRLEGWNKTRHQNECQLLTGSSFQTVMTPASFEDIETEDPLAIERRYFFDVADIKSYKIRIRGRTDNALETYHVAERVDRARKSM